MAPSGDSSRCCRPRSPPRANAIPTSWRVTSGCWRPSRWRDELHAAADIACGHPMLPGDHLCCGDLGVAAGLMWLGQEQKRPGG